MIKYSKDILWLEPFVESSKNLIDYKNIKAIKSFKVNTGCMEHIYGSLIKKGSKCTINLKTWDIQPNLITYKKSRIAIILETLAHELAHTKYFSHDYKHFKLTAQILLKFSKVIKKMKINDTSERVKEKL